MSSSLKPLYVAKSVKELNTKVSSQKASSSTPRMLCKSADLLFLTAKDKMLNGDQESAYILFMRYLDLMQAIRSSKEFKSNKKSFEKLLDVAKFKQALDEAEKLSTSLNERYERLNEDQNESESSSNTKKPRLTPSGQGGGSGEDQIVPDPQRASSDMVTKGKASLLDQVAPVSLRGASITPEKLYSLLSGCPGDVLVLDCRLRADYVSSHVDGKKYPQWLCVAEEAIKKGNLKAFLTPKQKKLWEERRQRQWIVLIDASSTADTITNSDPTSRSSVIISLRDALTKWDSETPLHNEPVVLDGGYDQWYLAYSPLCTGKWQRKDQKKEKLVLQPEPPQHDVSLAYPSFPDISLLSSVNNIPMEEPEPDDPISFPSPPKNEVVPVVNASNGPLPGPQMSEAPLPTSHLKPSATAVVTNGDVGRGLAVGMAPSFGNALPSAPLQPLAVPAPIQPLPPAPGMTVPLALEGHGRLIENGLHPLDTFVLPVEPAQPPEKHAGPSHMIPMHNASNHASFQGVGATYHHSNQMPETQGHWTPQNAVSGHVYQKVHEPQARYYPEPDSHAQTYSHAHSQFQPSHLQPQTYSQAVPGPVPAMQPQSYSQVPQIMSHPGTHELQANSHPIPGSHQPHTHSSPQEANYYYPHGTTPVPQHPQAYSQPGPDPTPPSVGQNQPYFQPPHPQTVANPRVAVGPIPEPPNYEQAQYLPSHPPTPLPLPPPISLSQTNQTTSQAGFSPSGSPSQGPSTTSALINPGSSGQVMPDTKSHVTQPSQSPENTSGHGGSSSNVSRPSESGSESESPALGPGAVSKPSESEPRAEKTADESNFASGPSESGSQVPSPSKTGVEIASVAENATSRSDTSLEGNVHHSSERELALAEREKALEERERQLQQATKDQIQQEVDERLQRALQREHERSKKEREEERTQLVEQLQHEREQLRKEHEQLRQDREEVQRQTEEMRRVRDQYEKEAAAILKQREEQLHYWEQLRQQESQQQLVMSTGLPKGWEKRLDRNTGRFYYIDHTTKTTHWNPPTHLLQYQAELQQQKQQAAAAMLPGQPGAVPAQLPPPVAIPIPMQPGSRTDMGRVQGPVPMPSQGQVPVPSQGQVPVPPQGQAPMLSQAQAPMPSQGQVPVPPQGPVPTSTAQLPLRQTGTQVPKSSSWRPPTTPQAGKAPPAGGPSPQTQTSAGNRNDSVGMGKSPPKQPTQHPSVDRSTKPKTTATKPQVNRLMKPMSMEEYKQRIFNLQPVHGGMGAGITGMRNLGNTCFMSSVLQCLCSTIPLVYHFVSNKYRTELNRANPLGSGGALAEEFFIICRAIWFENYRHISPRDFKNTVSRFAPYFAGHEQHDSQEFLVYLLDGIHEDLNRVLVKDYIEIAENDGIPDAVAAQRSWEVHKRRNDSIIVDLFHGMFKSTLTCLTCNKHKVMFEPFVSLSVPLPQGRRSCSYTECLKMFAGRERMSGDNRWHCPNCKAFRDAEKSIRIWRLPPVLLLHFKRFIDKGTFREKNSAHISFPVENLDLSPYMAGPKPSKQYNLYAISNHTGTLTGGHYTACCKHPQAGRFYFFDDQEVRDANQRDLASPSAYLLFYTSEEFKSLKLF